MGAGHRARVGWLSRRSDAQGARRRRLRSRARRWLRRLATRLRRARRLVRECSGGDHLASGHHRKRLRHHGLPDDSLARRRRVGRRDPLHQPRRTASADGVRRWWRFARSWSGGSEVAYDLGQTSEGADFLQHCFGAKFVADASNSYTAAGSGPLASVVSFAYSSQQGPYFVAYPDVLGTSGASGEVVLQYGSGTGAAVGVANQGVLVGFPLELIDNPVERAATYDELLTFVGHRNALATTPKALTKATWLRPA